MVNSYQKVGHYLPKEIDTAAHLLGLANPEGYIARAKASGVVASVRAELEAKERRRLERNLRHPCNLESPV